MKRITVELPDDVSQRLEDLSAHQRMPVEQAAADILRRRLTVDRFRELCAESASLSQAAGFESEEQVLRDIS
jgi:predicted transcriptional regulator